MKITKEWIRKATYHINSGLPIVFENEVGQILMIESDYIDGKGMRYLILLNGYVVDTYKKLAPALRKALKLVEANAMKVVTYKLKTNYK